MHVRLDICYMSALENMALELYETIGSPAFQALHEDILAGCWFADTWSDSFLTCELAHSDALYSADIALAFALKKYGMTTESVEVTTLGESILVPSHDVFHLKEQCVKLAIAHYSSEPNASVAYSDPWKAAYMASFLAEYDPSEPLPAELVSNNSGNEIHTSVTPVSIEL